MELDIDWRIWAVSVLAALFAYTGLSLGLEGELSLLELAGFVTGFAAFWIVFRLAQQKLGGEA